MDENIELMKRIHCSQHSEPANFAFLDWDMIKPDPEGNIFWHLVNFPPNFDKFKTVLAFERALDTWQQAFDRLPPVGRVIKLTSTSDFFQGYPDSLVRIFFMEPLVTEQEYTVSDGSKYILVNRWPFSGPKESLAHRPPNKHQLHFDSSENWSDMASPDEIRLTAVVVHEFGHNLDLAHSKMDSIMAPYYDPESLELKEDDNQGLFAKWGPPKIEVYNRTTGYIPPIIPETKGGCLGAIILL